MVIFFKMAKKVVYGGIISLRLRSKYIVHVKSVDYEGVVWCVGIIARLDTNQLRAQFFLSISLRDRQSMAVRSVANECDDYVNQSIGLSSPHV